MASLPKTLPQIEHLRFFQEAGEACTACALEEADWFNLSAGTSLFRAGDRADAIYFVVSGTLAAFRETPNGTELVGYIRAGEPVGEMALIAGEPHRGSVYAVRDAEILRLTRDAFERLSDRHPSILRALSRTMLRRARELPSQRAPSEPRLYALIASSPTIDVRMRAQALVDSLVALGKKACIIGEEAQNQPPAWFDELESAHDVVFAVTPVRDSDWFRWCLRQADRIWLLARADARPSVPLWPEDPSPARRFRLVDLVMLHHGSDRKAATTAEWRDAADAVRVFHWDGVADDDCGRLARTIAGKSIGLVMAGGGARAYSHIGVIRALRESRVPIDFVGGTSMGAVIAACLAMGWNDAEIEWRIRKAFVETNPLGDYQLPVISFSKGGRVQQRLLEHFGDSLIEDLQIPFYCVSTNITAASVRLHTEGLLRVALRASISLPGILPPVVEGESVLVDGAVLNNFPVDIMKQLHRGATIGVDVARPEGINPRDFMDAPDFFGWVAEHGLQSAPPIASLLMRTATMTVDPWAWRKDTDLLIVPDMPDIDLRDWKKFDEAIEAGYVGTMAALERQASERLSIDKSSVMKRN